METPNQYKRTAALLGEGGLCTLQNAHVAVFGIGGVGGYTAEALARCGIGTLTLVDGDIFAPSNLNRQLFATSLTLGLPKAQAARERLLTIAPCMTVHAVNCFYNKETESQFDFSAFDYVVDAIDDVPAKLALTLACAQAGLPLIMAMGAGNKLDPCAFRVCDLQKTHTDPLAKTLRRALGQVGIRHIKTVCSSEPPRTPDAPIEADTAALSSKRTVGSLPFVVGAAGMALAGAVVSDLCGYTEAVIPTVKTEQKGSNP